MAGDWIKVEKATARKPEVIALAEALSIHPDHAFGLCVRFWSWCDDHIEDGHARGVTKTGLDLSFGVTGLADALEKVGWLRDRNGALEVPHFDRHMSQSAKNRALASERKRAERAKKRHDSSVTKTRQQRDQRREEKSIIKATPLNTPLTPQGGQEATKIGKLDDLVLPAALDTDAFRDALAKWRRHRTEIKKPLKPTMLAAQLAQCAKWGEQRAVAAINHTVAMGWQGLREPDPPMPSDRRSYGGSNRPQRNATEPDYSKGF